MSTEGDDIQEPCPKCGALHTRGPYLPHTNEKGQAVVGPHDVRCSCGLELRWRVPIFKMTKSGYQLGVLRNDEKPFFKEPT